MTDQLFGAHATFEEVATAKHLLAILSDYIPFLVSSFTVRLCAPSYYLFFLLQRYRG